MCGDAFERAFADPEDQAQALHSLQVRLQVLRRQLDPEALLDAPRRDAPAAADGRVHRRRSQRAVDEAGLSADEAAMLQTGVLWAQGFLDAVRCVPRDLGRARARRTTPSTSVSSWTRSRPCCCPPAATRRASTPRHTGRTGEPTPRRPARRSLLGGAGPAPVLGRPRAEAGHAARGSPTPGRNDPCPCGSGKKYKKCQAGPRRGLTVGCRARPGFRRSSARAPCPRTRGRQRSCSRRWPAP